MAKVSVKVKFLKDKHDIEIMLDEPVELFKAQVGTRLIELLVCSAALRGAVLRLCRFVLEICALVC